jgi:hypothetical protein
MSNNPFQDVLDSITRDLPPMEMETVERNTVFVQGLENCPFYNMDIFSHDGKKRTRCGHCAMMGDRETFYFLKDPSIIYDISGCIANSTDWTDAQVAQYRQGLKDRNELQKQGILPR